MEVTNLEKNNNLKICTFPNSFSKEAELSQLVEKEKKKTQFNYTFVQCSTT